MPSPLRTALALVALMPVFAAVASCSDTEPSPSPTNDNTVVHGSALSLIQSFRFAPQVQNLDAEPYGRHVIEASPGVKLTATSTGFAITSPPLSRRLVAKQAEMTLPARLDAGFTIVDEGTKLGIDVKLVGATSSEGKIAETGLLVYENGFGQGRHVVHRPHTEGIEDYVVFEQRPEVEELRYEVQVPKKAGLRLVSNVLEVVDEDGAPRLRMTAPAVVQQDGAQVVPTVQVEGCAVDADTRLPWGRPITAPGAEVCSVVVGWRVDSYPVVVDPAWTTTGSMKTERSGHTATLLSSGKVLVAGGGGIATPTEVYDPGTGTWTAGGSLKAEREWHTATLLASNKVLVAGGYDGSTRLASTEVYDPGTGKWTSGPDMATARYAHTATLLPSGKILVVGGYGPSDTELVSAEVYDPTTGIWTSGPNMKTARYWHTATALADGKVLVAGGWGPGNEILVSAEVYNPVGSTWADTGDMKEARMSHTATALASGKILVVGGGIGTTAEVYAPATGTWTNAGNLKTVRDSHTATLLANSKVLVAGGDETGTSTEMYDPASNKWTSAGNLTTARSEHTATALPNGKVLVTGRTGKSGPLKSAEEWTAEMLGGTCEQSGECKSGFCVNGVCCDTICDNVCEACSNDKTGKPDGTCAPIKVNTNPNNKCGQKENGKDCTVDTDCTSGFCTDGVCCNDKCKGQCEACDVSGKVGQCVLVPKGDAPHNVEKGARLACKGENNSCAGSCDGASSTCVYPGSTIHCDDSCEQDSFVAALCDSQGGCAKQKPISCTPYACDLGAKGCRTSCETSADCTTGNVCNAVTKTCGPATSTCVDATHVKGTSGQVETCPAGYTCSSATGTCNTKCSANAECDTASGYKCEGSECKKDAGSGGAAGAAGGSTTAGAGTGGASTAGAGKGGSATTTAEPGGMSEDDGGCGCEVPRSSRSTTWPSLAVAGLALASLRRRSRRC